MIVYAAVGDADQSIAFRPTCRHSNMRLTYTMRACYWSHRPATESIGTLLSQFLPGRVRDCASDGATWDSFLILQHVGQKESLERPVKEDSGRKYGW